MNPQTKNKNNHFIHILIWNVFLFYNILKIEDDYFLFIKNMKNLIILLFIKSIKYTEIYAWT